MGGWRELRRECAGPRSTWRGGGEARAASARQGDRRVLHAAHGRSLVGTGCGHHDLRTRALQKAPAGELGCQGPERDRHRALPSGVGRKLGNGAAAPWGPGFLGPCRLPGVPLSLPGVPLSRGLGQTFSFYRRAGRHGWEEGDRRGTPIGRLGRPNDGDQIYI